MRIYKLSIAVCAFWFIFLCLFHYFSCRPLWLDENYVLNTIKSLSFRQILGPIKDSEEFPRIYLIVIKYLSERFNYNLLSLRFLPLISMLSAFFIWLKVYERELIRKWQTLLAIFSFTSSYYMSYYAAELKHYSVDVLVAGIFCLYLAYQRRYLEKKQTGFFALATFILPFTIFFSYSSFFLFWIIIYNFLFFIKKNSKILPILITYTLICVFYFILIFHFDIKHTLSTIPLFSYWNDYFLCTQSFYCFIRSFAEGFQRLAMWWFGNTTFFRRLATCFVPFFVFSLFGYGVKSLRKNKFMLWDMDGLSLVIFAELFALGIMKKYPFTGERITLFFAPFVFYLIIKGIGSLRRYKPLYLGFNIFYLLLLVLSSANSFLMYLKLYP